jgi:hypothetical protein
MSELLAVNLEALRKRYPGFRDLSDNLESISPQAHQRALSQPILRRVNHSQGVGFFLIEGLGGGECFDWLSPFLEKEESIFIVVEPDELQFARLCQTRDLRFALENPRIQFIFTNKLSEFSSQILSSFHKRRAALLPFLTIIRSPHVRPQDETFFELCEKQLESNLDLFSSMAGYRQDGLTGLRYFVENIPWIEQSRGISAFENKFSGASAIVASTGPSLGKALEKLQELQNTHVIIAADASLKILLKAGIRPHFVCTLERELASKPFFEGIDADLSSAQLVAFPEVPAEVIQAYSGPKLVAYRKQLSHLYFEQQAPRGIIGAGHSVAHMCMHLAAYMGCKEIALVGQDLAFDPDSLSTHAENVAYFSWSQANSQEELKARLAEERDQLFWMPGNLRETVPTRGYYVVFAWEFGAQAAQLKSRVINCTEGGMKIPGIPWMRFDSWIQQSPHCSDLNSILLPKSEREQKVSIDLAPLIQSIRSWEQSLSNQSFVLKAIGANNKPNPSDPFLVQSVQLLKSLKKDHVIEAFAQDVLGKELIPFETKLVGIEKPEQMSSEDLKSLAAYFDVIVSGLADSRAVLTQKAK